MAEGIAKQLLSKRIPFPVRVSSAGSSAVEGMPASALAVEVARQFEVDLSGHRSRLLNATMVRSADLIVTMGEKHRETVGVIEPEALSYTYRLTDFSDRHEGDVTDPIGGDGDVYRSTFELIRDCIESMTDKLEAFDGWRGGAASGRNA